MDRNKNISSKASKSRGIRPSSHFSQFSIIIVVFILLTSTFTFIFVPWHNILEISHTIRKEAFVISNIVKSSIRRYYHPIPPEEANVDDIGSGHNIDSNHDINVFSGFLRNISSVFVDKRSSTTFGISSSSAKLKKGGAIMIRIKELFDLAKASPDSLIDLLNTTDPFGTKVLDPYDFKYDVDDILPNHVNITRQHHFKNHELGYYVFFQHLRKAGGTSFCELARSNMDRKRTPSYYCMPDNKGSLATPPWNNYDYIHDMIIKHDYYVVANEWDVFYQYFLNYHGALYATTIRHPLDRWYSQYRFEHLEHRDGSSQTAKRLSFPNWYHNNRLWTMGTNYYVKTFIGDVGSNVFLTNANKDDFYWTYHQYTKQDITWTQFHNAINVISHFHLILVLEWIQSNSTQDIIDSSLGWKNPIKQVLPHEVQAMRAVKKSVNVHDMISEDEYRVIARENVLDLLFYEIVRRMYLERVAQQVSTVHGRI